LYLLGEEIWTTISTMVAGKGTPQSLAKAATAPKLPPLPKLRVRRPNETNANPCIGVMSTVLGMSSLEGRVARMRLWRALGYAELREETDRGAIRLLGITRLYDTGLCGIGTVSTCLHGREGMLRSSAPPCLDSMHADTSRRNRRKSRRTASTNTSRDYIRKCKDPIRGSEKDVDLVDSVMGVGVLGASTWDYPGIDYGGRSGSCVHHVIM